MGTTYTFLLDLSVCFGATLWLGSWLISKRRISNCLPLPPGPSRRLPLIGNLLDMPTKSEHLTIDEWGKKYGGWAYVEVLGRPYLFITSYDIVTDLMVKRSSIYSDRPPFPMLELSDMLGWMLPTMPYCETMRKHRGFFHRYLQPMAVPAFVDGQTRHTRRMVARMLESPEDFATHIHRNAAATIGLMTYGHDGIEPSWMSTSNTIVNLDTEQELGVYAKVVEGLPAFVSEALRPGAYLIEFLPWLKYVPKWCPGASFHKKAKEGRKISHDSRHIPYQKAKQDVLNGSARFSMVSQLIEANMKEDGQVEDEADIMGCAAVTHGGGFDTIVSAILSFVLAMVLNPNAQRQGQEELDSVVGRDRLPTFEDHDALPYVRGILKETLRWNPVVRQGFPHRLMKDDTYNGFFIPAGCVIVANQWSMLHEEAEYPNHEAFLPERWLPNARGTQPRDPSKMAFGFGRRMCPGKHFAENSIFLAIATMLATVGINKALDEEGQPITPTVAYRPGFTTHPEEFRCSITPRSSQAAALILEANVKSA